MSDAIISEATPLPTYEVTHLLTFDGVEDRYIQREISISDPFWCRDDPIQTRFTVELHFGDWEPGWLSCFLVPTEKDVFIKKATFRVSDVNNNDAQSFSFEGKLVKQALGWGPPKLLNLRKFSFPEDAIRFQCDIVYIGEPKTDETNSPPVRDPNLHEDLLKIFLNAEGTDVTITVQEKMFKAHKHVLKARSDYFRALFESGMEESRTNEVDIEDADPESFECFLEFLYSGVPPSNQNVAFWDLLALADRFGAFALKDMCEAAIISDLSVTNVLRALSLANAHSCSSLRKKCLPLIRENLKSLVTTEDWKLLEENAKLPVMVLESFVV